MHAERDYLVKRVFPQLREWCEQRKLRLIDIDLRWGITEADATNKNVVKVCLTRIDECRPFFLCFVSQRRGWVPGKDEIASETIIAFPDLQKYIGDSSVTEMEILHAVIDPMNNQDRAACSFFYLRDPSYLDELPKTPIFFWNTYTNEGIHDADERKRAEEELRVWRKEKIPKTGRPVHHYSATWNSQETTPELAIPLQCPSQEIRNQERWKSQWRELGIEPASLDLTDDESLAGKARDKNDEITKGRLGSFRCEDNTLADSILNDLKAAIAEQNPDHMIILAETPLQKELDQQEQFLELNCSGFIRREGDFEALDSYIVSNLRDLFVLTAPGGMGKTMLLANWIQKHQQRYGNERPVFYRFIGASDGSTTVDAVIRSLLTEIKEAGLLPDEIPDDPKELRNKFLSFLAAIGSHCRCIIVLDGLNQLESGLKDLYWLPRKIPNGLHIVVSFKSEGVEAEKIASQLSLSLPDTYYEIKPFESPEDRKKLISAYLDQYLKQLDDRLIQTVIDSPGAQNPLYLKVVLSELRIYGSFANLEEKIREDFGTTPVEAFRAVLKRLEKDLTSISIPAEQAVPLLFGLLSHARVGLTENELIEFFIRNLSSEAWLSEDAIRVLIRQMRPFLARRKGRHDFFYESFRQASVEQYEGNEKERYQRTSIEWHGILADHFFHQDFFLKSAEDQDNQSALKGKVNLKATSFQSEIPPREPNVRKLSELIFHLVESKRSDDARKVLENPTFIELNVQCGRISELDFDFLNSLRLAADQGCNQISVQIGYNRIKFRSRFAGSLFKTVETALNGGITTIPRLQDVLRYSPGEDLFIAINLVCLKELERLEIPRTSVQSAEITAQTLSSLTGKMLPGPIGIFLIHHLGIKGLRSISNFIKTIDSISQFEFGDELSIYLSSLTSVILNDSHSITVIANQLSDLVLFYGLKGSNEWTFKSLFYGLDEIRPFNKEITFICAAGLFVENRDWYRLCNLLKNYNNYHTNGGRWSLQPRELKCLFHTLTWINRRITQIDNIELPEEQIDIRDALHKIWKSSRTRTVLGARIASEVSILANKLLPADNLAKIVKEDLYKRPFKLENPNHRAFILLNIAEFHHQRYEQKERDHFFKEGYNQAMKGKRALPFAIFLSAKFFGTAHVKSLIEAHTRDYLHEHNIELAWRLFRLRLYEETLSKETISWPEFIEIIATISNNDVSLIKNIPLYAVQFCLTSDRFFPLLKGINPINFSQAIEACRRKTSFDDWENYILDAFCNGQLTKGTFFPEFILKKFPNSNPYSIQEYFNLGYYVQDVFHFDHMPDELIPAPPSTLIHSRTISPWIGTKPWQVQTEEDLQNQTRMWAASFLQKLRNRIDKMELQNDITIELIRAYLDPSINNDSAQLAANRLLKMITSSRTIGHEPVDLCALAMLLLPKDMRNAALQGAGIKDILHSHFYPSELIDLHIGVYGYFDVQSASTEGSGFSLADLVAWWKSSPVTDNRRRILYRLLPQIANKWCKSLPNTEFRQFVYELTRAGEIEFFKLLIELLNKVLKEHPQMIEPRIALFLAEMWGIEAEFIHGKMPDIAILKSSARIFQSLSCLTVHNSIHALAYEVFFGFIVLHPELDNDQYTRELVEYLLDQQATNLAPDWRAGIAKHVAQCMLFSKRILFPPWFERLIPQDDADWTTNARLFAELVANVLQMDHDGNIIEVPSSLKNYSPSSIKEVAEHFTIDVPPKRLRYIGQVMKWLVASTSTYKLDIDMMQYALPVAIYADLPEADTWLSTIFNKSNSFSPKQLSSSVTPVCIAVLEIGQDDRFLLIFSKYANAIQPEEMKKILIYLVRKRKRKILRTLLYQIYSEDLYFRWTILALCSAMSMSEN